MSEPTDQADCCNVCNHPLVLSGNEWQCTHRCRCMMMGCVPRRNARPIRTITP